jgi:hypothetical protein
MRIALGLILHVIRRSEAYVIIWRLLSDSLYDAGSAPRTYGRGCDG